MRRIEYIKCLSASVQLAPLKNTQLVRVLYFDNPSARIYLVFLQLHITIPDVLQDRSCRFELSATLSPYLLESSRVLISSIVNFNANADHLHMHLFRRRHGSSSFVNPTAHLTCPWSSSSVGIAFDDHGNAHDATEYMAHAIVKHCQRLRLHTHRVTHLPSFNFDDRFILALDHLPPPVLLSPIVSSLASRLNRLPAPIPDRQSEEYQDLFDYVLSSCIHDYVHGPLYPHQYSCDIALFHPDSPAMHVACIRISLTGRLPYFDILDAIKRSPYITFRRRFYYCTYPLPNTDNVALIVTSSPDPVWIDSCTSVFCNHAMGFSPLWRFPGIYIPLTRTLIPTFASDTSIGEEAFAFFARIVCPRALNPSNVLATSTNQIR